VKKYIPEPATPAKNFLKKAERIFFQEKEIYFLKKEDV